MSGSTLFRDMLVDIITLRLRRNDIPQRFRSRVQVSTTCSLPVLLDKHSTAFWQVWKVPHHPKDGDHMGVLQAQGTPC